MQKLNPIQVHSRFAIKGNELWITSITHFAKQLSGVKIVRLIDALGNEYKFTQWPDGVVYRINRIKK